MCPKTCKKEGQSNKKLISKFAEKNKYIEKLKDPMRFEPVNDTEWEKRSRFLSWGFLLPSIIGVLIFFVIPFFVVIRYSFINNPISNTFVGFKNYINVCRNLAFRKATLNTLIFSLVAVPLSVVLSLFLALLLDNKIPYKSQIRTFLLTPLMVPIASVVLIWQVLFHYDGTMSEILVSLGGGRVDWLNSGFAQVVIVILFLWKNLGYNMILFMSALGSIPQSLLEVASLESATRWQVFKHIKIRYITSTIMFVIIMSLVNSFKIFREIYLLKGDYPYDTMYMLQHFMNNTFKSLDYQKMSAAAIIMAILLSLIMGTLFMIEAHLGKDVEGE